VVVGEWMGEDSNCTDVKCECEVAELASSERIETGSNPTPHPDHMDLQSPLCHSGGYIHSLRSIS
jgi:hypothetical protein